MDRGCDGWLSCGNRFSNYFKGSKYAGGILNRSFFVIIFIIEKIYNLISNVLPNVEVAGNSFFGVGDYLYNPDMEYIHRQALHSWKLSFIHPITKEPMEFIAGITERYEKFLFKETLGTKTLPATNQGVFFYLFLYN